MLIVLIYTIRLSIKPSVKLNIHNQCSNIDLISPTYHLDVNVDCHRPPDYKVCTGDITRSGFISRSEKNFYAVLIYKLQRKQPGSSTEMSKDTSRAAHLLVVWRLSWRNEFHADVMVVEYDKGHIWKDDDLKKLYHENIYSSKLYPGTATEIWSLNDNVALMATSEAISEDRIVNVTISEVEKGNSMRTPICIDLKR
jgi:hypothetical protein